MNTHQSSSRRPIHHSLICRVLLVLVVCSCDPPETINYVMGENVSLGTHRYRADLPEEFEEFQEGQDVDVVIGTQGSMMVVAAVRTNRVPWSEDPFTVTIALADKDGTEQSRLSMRRYPTFESDGMMYFSNLYAVVTDTLGQTYEWDGELASLSVEIHSVHGDEYLNEVVKLRLIATEELF